MDIYVYILYYFPIACNIFIDIPCAFCTAHYLLKLTDMDLLLVAGSYN